MMDRPPATQKARGMLGCLTAGPGTPARLRRRGLPLANVRVITGRGAADGVLISLTGRLTGKGDQKGNGQGGKGGIEKLKQKLEHVSHHERA